MDRGGQEVLAHARLAVEQHVGVGLGRDFDHPPHAVHGGRAADDGRLDVGGREGLRRSRLGGLPLPLDAGQERKEVLVAEGLGEEVERPQLDRLDGHGNAAVGGHHNDFHRRQRAFLDPLQQFDAVEPRHLQIGHHHVERPGGEFFERFVAVGGRDDFVPLRRQIVGQGDALDLFVVDDKDFHRPVQTGDKLRLPISVFSVTHGHDVDDALSIVNGVDDTIIADSQILDPRQYPSYDARGKRFQFPASRSRERNGIFSHASASSPVSQAVS